MKPRTAGPDNRTAPSKPGAVSTALTLLGIAAAFTALYLFFVRTAPGQRLDERGAQWASAVVPPGSDLEARLRWLDSLPDAAVVAGALMLLVCLWARRSEPGHAPQLIARVIVVPALAAGCAMAATQVLKHAVLSRPNLGVTGDELNLFPSGHTTAATAMAAAAMLAAPAGWRRVVIATGVVASAVVGWGTFIMGWHRPSDIAGAYLVCAFFAVAGCWALRWPALQARSGSRGALQAH